MARKCLKSRIVSEISVSEGDSKTTTSPLDSDKEESSCSTTSLSLSSRSGEAKEGPNSPNQLEQSPTNLHLNLPPQSTPLDLRIRKRKKTRSGSGDNQQVKNNFILSDTNPVCSQIYSQALKETRHDKLMSSVSQSDVEQEMAGEEDPQNMSDRRRRRLKNERAQRLRNHEKDHHFWMLVQAHNMEQRNAALHTQLDTLEREKTELQNIIYRHMQRMRNTSNVE